MNSVDATVRRAAWLVCFLLVLATVAVVSATENPQAMQQRITAQVSAPVTPYLFTGDVRELPPPVQWKPGDPVKEIPRRAYPIPGRDYDPQGQPTPDALLQIQNATPPNTNLAFVTPSRNFAGQGYTGVNPPDTVGDVGPNHYIQSINASGGAVVRIWDKAEPTPNELATFDMDSLGSGSCASGLGDPIVLYDRLADRWMLSEFSSSGNNLCVYISQTADPLTGGWFAYGFQAPSFPDYPKYGVWPTDANGGLGSYIITTNESGSGVYAVERAKMLVGDPTTFQRFVIADLSGFPFNAVTPADMDGPDGPPSGAPAVIMRQRDTEVHGGPAAPEDVLEIWHYDVDWVDTGNTTLTQLTDIDVAEFDSALCGLSAFACFQQPGSSTTLDPLREVIMNRLQYYNRGDYETLAGNFVTDVDGNDLGGLRWFELRRSGGGPWTLYQEGTYAPDGDSRWMAGSAMDQSENFAIAYNVSSSVTFPSLRYTGRLVDDALGTLTQAEAVIHDGTASNSSNRYGDYSAMNLDPLDDCTFWFTGMDNTSSSWRTQVASFAFEACGCDLAPSPLTASAQVIGDNQVEIGWNDADLVTVIEYTVYRSRTAGGPYSAIATLPDSSPGIAGGPDYFYVDTDVSGGIDYYYVVRASDGESCKSDNSNEASVTATGLCTLPPLFDGLQAVSTPFSGTCTLNLSWTAATPECGGPMLYNVYRSITSGFDPDVNSLIKSDVAGTTFEDIEQLTSGTPYYYVVRAVDTAIGVEETNAVEVGGVAYGNLTTGTWTDDAGDTGFAQMLLEAPWAVDPTEGNLGPSVYKTGSYGNNLCAGLTTPELKLGVGAQLTFSSKYEIENSYDKGEVQISTDGGVTWQRIDVAYPGTSTNSSDSCGLPTGDYFTGSGGGTWDVYTADLSAWNDLFVKLRFALSTDGSVNGNGWWIDDISITQVDVPGVCSPGSACEDNPSVDVTPDGPMTVCLGTEIPLAAALNGGTGPFSYQWTRDGVDVGGAVDPSFPVNETGTHTYNARVKADTCPDPVTDGLATQIQWQETPVFDGIVSATDPQSPDCTVNLDWNPAATACPSGVTYTIYRDTSSPVELIPANVIDSTGQVGYSDTADLLTGQDYHYVVRAVDNFTGLSELNVAEASAVPSGPGGGPQVLFFEDFSNTAVWADWTVATGPGPHDCGEFALVDQTTARPTNSSGFFALSNSDACGSGSLTSTSVDSPVIDADIAGAQTITLSVDMYYNYYNGDDATVEVWDGAAWQVVWADADVDANQHFDFDVTAYALGNPAFQIRFNYQNASFDFWLAFDNVEVIADVDSPCQTVSGGSGPAPAPDGRLGTTPLTGELLSPAGDSIRVGWDTASCTASGYNLIYGDLDGVSGYALTGSQCSIGTGGSFDWNAVPAGSVYFLVVGLDGAGTESSWGLDSGLGERNGFVPSGECGTSVKDPTGTCP